MNSYEQLSELVRAYGNYEATQAASDDLADFGQWLANRRAPAQTTDGLIGTEANPPDDSTGAPLDERLGRVIGRLYRFVEFYSKKVLGELELNNLGDFTYLGALHAAGNPRKSELIAANLSEFTSGIDIIKRLTQGGLAEEYTDPDDRRSKRLRITPRGTQVLLASYPLMSQVGSAVFFGLPEADKRRLLAVLVPLDQFHSAHFPALKEATMEAVLARLAVSESPGTVR